MKKVRIMSVIAMILTLVFVLVGCKQMTPEEQAVYDAGKEWEAVLDEYEKFIEKSHKNLAQTKQDVRDFEAAEDDFLAKIALKKVMYINSLPEEPSEELKTSWDEAQKVLADRFGDLWNSEENIEIKMHNYLLKNNTKGGF